MNHAIADIAWEPLGCRELPSTILYPEAKTESLPDESRAVYVWQRDHLPITVDDPARSVAHNAWEASISRRERPSRDLQLRPSRDLQLFVVFW
ncbi:hypothetical protein [Nitrospira sp. Nam80]